MPDPRPHRELTSAANPRVKTLTSLRRRRTRDELGLTLVEGHDELRLALESGVRPHALYYCPELHGTADDPDLLERIDNLGSDVFRLDKKLFDKVAYRESPDGWLAVIPMVSARLDDLDLRANPLVLVCEAVEKPGNLGAMLRTADAVGADAVIACRPVTDWGNPNLIRSSKGTIFTVPVAASTSAEAMAWLRANELTVVATTPESHSSLTAVDFTGATAIVVGTEKTGLSGEWLGGQHQTVRIPMHGTVNSLNVATSAALVMYEALRQRAG